MQSKPTVLIADPNTFLRDGLTRLMRDTDEFVLVGEAANDVRALELAEEAKPDVLLLDLVIPMLHAVPILLAMKEQNLPTKVLIMTELPDETKVLNSARAGARGYILKSTSSAALAEATREVFRGRIWVDRNAGFADNFALLAHQAKSNNEAVIGINPLDVLTKKEVAILHLIARGTSNEDIAKKLLISVPTVKCHISHIFGKLHVKNRTQAALLLMQAQTRFGHDDPANLQRSA